MILILEYSPGNYTVGGALDIKPLHWAYLGTSVKNLRMTRVSWLLAA